MIRKFLKMIQNMFANRLPSTILLLDDDPKIREVLKIFLKEFKYSVLEASNKDEAVAKLKDNLDDCNELVRTEAW